MYVPYTRNDTFYYEKMSAWSTAFNKHSNCHILRTTHVFSTRTPCTRGAAEAADDAQIKSEHPALWLIKIFTLLRARKIGPRIK